MALTEICGAAGCYVAWSISATGRTVTVMMTQLYKENRHRLVCNLTPRGDYLASLLARPRQRLFVNGMRRMLQHYGNKRRNAIKKMISRHGEGSHPRRAIYRDRI